MYSMKASLTLVTHTICGLVSHRYQFLVAHMRIWKLLLLPGYPKSMIMLLFSSSLYLFKSDYLLNWCRWLLHILFTAFLPIILSQSHKTGEFFSCTHKFTYIQFLMTTKIVLVMTTSKWTKIEINHFVVKRPINYREIGRNTVSPQWSSRTCFHLTNMAETVVNETTLPVTSQKIYL